MAMTNPTVDDFGTWIKEHLQEKSNNIIVSAGIELLSGGIKYITVRKNYVIFSVYKIPYGNTEYEFFGIFKTFIPLSN